MVNISFFKEKRNGIHYFFARVSFTMYRRHDWNYLFVFPSFFINIPGLVLALRSVATILVNSPKSYQSSLFPTIKKELEGSHTLLKYSRAAQSVPWVGLQFILYRSFWFFCTERQGVKILVFVLHHSASAQDQYPPRLILEDRCWSNADRMFIKIVFGLCPDLRLYRLVRFVSRADEPIGFNKQK